MLNYKPNFWKTLGQVEGVVWCVTVSFGTLIHLSD